MCRKFLAMKRSLIVVSLLAFAVGFVGCNYKRKAGNEIVAKVEYFKKSTGRLPKTLPDIGLQETENCPCYCKTGSDSYMVWYGTTMGESDTYDSRTKHWSEAAGLVCAK